MANDYRVKIEGLSELVERLKRDPLHGRPLKRLLGRVSSNLKRQIRGVAPVRSGRLARGVFYRLEHSPVPQYSWVSDRAKRKRVRYPFVLEAGWRGGKHGQRIPLHFRGTGRSTAGWFTRMEAMVPGLIAQAFPAFKRQVEARFNGKRDE